MLRTCRVRRSRAGDNAIGDDARHGDAPDAQTAARLSSRFCRPVDASVALDGDSKRRPAANLGVVSPKTHRATKRPSRQNSPRQRAVHASQKSTPPEGANKNNWPPWPPWPTWPTWQNRHKKSPDEPGWRTPTSGRAMTWREYPVGESNPCLRRERALSWATRRTGRKWRESRIFRHQGLFVNWLREEPVALSQSEISPSAVGSTTIIASGNAAR